MKFKISNLKSIISVILGLTFFSTAIIAYWRNFQYIYELTFLSNIATGLFLLIAGMLERKEKKIPQILYLDFTVLLFMVFLICIAFINEFNFTGAIFFLHIINPLILMVYFFIFNNLSTINNFLYVLTILIIPLAYLAFAITFGSITGNYIYFFLNYKEKGIAYSIIFILIVSVCLVTIGYVFYFINRFFHMRNKKLELEK